VEGELTPEESEEAGRLLTAARSDLRATQVFVADTGQANDVIGSMLNKDGRLRQSSWREEGRSQTRTISASGRRLAEHATVTPESIQEAD